MHGADAVFPAEFAAQALDVGVEGAGAVPRGRKGFVLAPDLFIQIIAVEHPAAVAQQYQQKVVLLRGQGYGPAGAQHFAAAGIDRHIPGRKLQRPAPGPAQHALNPGDKLGRVERLDDVIVGPAVQPLDLIGRCGLGRNEDARGAGGQQVTQQVVAVDARHHDVEQHKVILVSLQQVGGFGSAGHGLAGVAGAGQRAADQLGNRGFVINNQDWFHGRVILSFPLSSHPNASEMQNKTPQAENLRRFILG